MLWSPSEFHVLTIAPHFVPEVMQSPSVRSPIAVSLGAVAGSLSRYYLSIGSAHYMGTEFPFSTIAVNISGAWIMGLFATLVLDRVLVISPELRLMIAVGFLGSFTTFSSHELDAFHLIEQRSLGVAIAYLLGYALVGALSLYVGVLTARLFVP